MVISILEITTHHNRRSISSDKLYNLSDENGWSGGILKKCHDNYIIIVTEAFCASVRTERFSSSIFCMINSERRKSSYSLSNKAFCLGSSVINSSKVDFIALFPLSILILYSWLMCITFVVHMQL